MFHSHAFKLHTDYRTLYCSCGRIKQLPCSHDWEVYREQVVSFWGSNQTQQILICSKCGEFKSVNLTTGKIE